jgi:hypothetical protein
MADKSLSEGAAAPGTLWSPDSESFRPVAAATNHLIDLARFFPMDGMRWSDMLVSMTRRHIAGCINALETALIVELDASLVAALSAAGGEGRVVWPVVQSHPHLIGPALLAHMRLRAGVGLLARGTGEGRGDAVAPEGEDNGWLVDDADQAVAGTAMALALAEGRWAAPDAEDAPMRPDLPAEHFSALVWMVAAALGMAIVRTGALPEDQAMAAVDVAALRLLARHEEQGGALAVALRLARMIRDREDRPGQMGRALGQGRILLFAALAAGQAEISIEAVLDVLVQQPVPVLAAFCHILGGTAADFQHLLLRLAPVRALDDAALIAAGPLFTAMDAAQAQALVAPLRRPAELRAPLSLLGAAGRGRGG